LFQAAYPGTPFEAMTFAFAQVGPGHGIDLGGLDDFGRSNIIGDDADRYRFRTTPLRHVELTAPYGHAGSILDLREFIAHYSESHLKLLAFDASHLEPALQGTLVPSAADIPARRDPILDGVVLPDEIVDRLMDYMSALTDDAARRMRHIAPTRVPSHLAVDR
jgi:cytochrome c peroxidase